MKSTKLYEDILWFSEKVINDALNPLNKIDLCSLYDCYRTFHTMNSSIYVLLNHYFALTFDEPYLVNSTSFKSPDAKWRTVLNEDLKKATDATRAYLLNLGFLKFNDHEENEDFTVGNPLENYIYHKNFYAFAKDYYSCGFIENESMELKRSLLTESALMRGPFPEECIDLSTYEKRANVVEGGKIVLNALVNFERILYTYLLENASVTDLLKKDILLSRQT